MLPSAAEQWAKARTFHHSLYPAGRIAEERKESVSVCLPARECAATVGEIVGALVRLREAGAIDEIVVVDAESQDGTARVAGRAGAKVVQERELMSELGAALGKGDAMWRALSVLEGELVVFLDADSEGFSEHFATGLLGPLVCERDVQFVKAFYRRPFEQEGISLAEGGGRVNHLMARPALALFYPQLAAVRQPLAGEVAARRELLEDVPFATGYGVEIAMLIDVWRKVGLDGIAQVDLEVHRNRHQSIAALSEMSETVLAAIVRRLVSEGRLSMDGFAVRSEGGSAGEAGHGREWQLGLDREGDMREVDMKKLGLGLEGGVAVSGPGLEGGVAVSGPGLEGGVRNGSMVPVERPPLATVMGR
jgi:glucosyl-3-phosphoglycerate synthase